MPLLLFVPVGVLNQLALNLMVWADLGFIKAVGESVAFIKHSFVKVIFVLQLVVSWASTKIPFGVILAYVASVMLTISTIDIFHKYRDTGEVPQPLEEQPIV